MTESDDAEEAVRAFERTLVGHKPREMTVPMRTMVVAYVCTWGAVAVAAWSLWEHRLGVFVVAMVGVMLARFCIFVAAFQLRTDPYAHPPPQPHTITHEVTNEHRG